jgi:hypothetical protein
MDSLVLSVRRFSVKSCLLSCVSLLLQAIENTRPSISSADLKRHAKWDSCFGSH